MKNNFFFYFLSFSFIAYFFSANFHFFAFSYYKKKKKLQNKQFPFITLQLIIFMSNASLKRSKIKEK